MNKHLFKGRLLCLLLLAGGITARAQQGDFTTRTPKLQALRIEDQLAGTPAT